MLSKDWKYLLIAPLAVSFLTACPGKNNNSNESVSTFTGVWMNEPAVSSYRRSFNTTDPNERENPERLRRFCAEVAQDCETFGLLAKGAPSDIVLDAVLIQVNGEVSRYAPDIRSISNNPGYVEALHVGHVNNDGTFSRTIPGARSYSQGYYRFGAMNRDNDPRFRVAVSDTYFNKVSSDQDRFTVDIANGGSAVYLRSSDGEMRDYLHRLHGCTGAPEDGSEGGPVIRRPIRPGPGPITGPIGPRPVPHEVRPIPVRPIPPPPSVDPGPDDPAPDQGPVVGPGEDDPVPDGQEPQQGPTARPSLDKKTGKKLLPPPQDR